MVSATDAAARFCRPDCDADVRAGLGPTDADDVVSSSITLSYSSGDSTVDGILAGPWYFWGAEATYGMSQTLTYSFMESTPDYYVGISGFQAFNEVMKAAARSALDQYAEAADLTFVEVADDGEGGQIRFGMESMDAGTVAYAYYPQKYAYGINDPTFAEYSGDVWMSTNYGDNLAPEAGNIGYYALLHELGHALGLKHPHEYPWLDEALDTEDNTVMSYNAGLDGDYASTLGWIDRLAVAYLYGPPEASTIGRLTADSDDASRLVGDGGPDYFLGNGGDDTLSGAGGNDGLIGGEGADWIFGDSGHDFVLSNQAADTVEGGTGNDTVYGGQDEDLISGGAGIDWLIGNRADDTILGGDGADVIYGGRDADLLIGGAGADALYGNLGDDTLSGGAGWDAFVFGADSGADTIADYERLQDWIVVARDVDGSGPTSVSAVYDAIADVDGEAVLDLGGGNSVTFSGVSRSEITTADIVLY